MPEIGPNIDLRAMHSDAVRLEEQTVELYKNSHESGHPNEAQNPLEVSLVEIVLALAQDHRKLVERTLWNEQGPYGFGKTFKGDGSDD
jgi:hypothetical protein